MSTVRVRKQGGAAVLTIPSDVLKQLDIGIGSDLELDIKRHILILKPINKSKVTPTRYTLKQLLKGVSHQKMEDLNNETEWAREGDATGREVA